MANQEVSFKCWEFSPKLKQLTEMYSNRPSFITVTILFDAIKKESYDVAPAFIEKLKKDIEPNKSVLETYVSILGHIDKLKNTNEWELDMFSQNNATGKNEKKYHLCSINAFFLEQVKEYALLQAAQELLDSLK